MTALRQLGEKLTVDEIKFLEKETNLERDHHFEKVSENSDDVDAIVKEVTKQVKNLNKPSASVPS